MNKNVKFISIEDDRYKKNKKSYQYAMDQTLKELKQAVEGMFHKSRIVA